MTFLRLTKEGSEHAKETVTHCHSFKIQGSRGPETPCMTIRGKLRGKVRLARHAQPKQPKAQPKKRPRRITGLRRGTGFYCIYCRFTVDLRTRPTEEEAEEDYAEGLGFTAFTVDLRDQSDRTSYTHTRITYFNILQITHILHILTFSIFTFSLNPPRQEELFAFYRGLPAWHHEVPDRAGMSFLRSIEL